MNRTHLRVLRIVLPVALCLSLIAQTLADEGLPSGHRAALLIGNADYGDFTLTGVAESLGEVERALGGVGFQITRRENLGQKDLGQAVEDFARSVPTNGVAVVYYVGLGAHAERFNQWYNLLRPEGEKIESDNDYRSRGLDVAKLIETLREKSGSRSNLLFLDACWASPILPGKGNIRGGLRGFEPEGEALVFFAAPSEQTVPASPNGVPSSLAQALAKHAGKLEGSLERTSQSMAAEMGMPWYTGAVETGIGPRSPFPVTAELREGKLAGEAFVNSIGMCFRWCPAGSFRMGSDQTGTAQTSDRSPVDVTLSQGYWMGEYEVTQREYEVIRGRTVPPGFTVHRNAPYWSASEVKGVTDFCRQLTDRERKAGRLPDGWEYVCPTEAEWEYACRAGSTAAYCFGDSIAELGRYGNFADRALHDENPDYYWAAKEADDGFGETLAPVGSFRPNAWGLRDMHGNVAELVADDLLPQLPGGTDPLARAEKNSVTQIRGGAWCSLPLYCESSFRNSAPGRDKSDFVGFRVALKKVK